MNLPPSAEKELVLVGGGHSHAIVLKRLAMRPLAGARVTLISNVSMTPYSGMVPGYVDGTYTYDECHIDLRRLAASAGARFILAEVDGLDPEARLIHMPDRPSLKFDFASLNLGSTPNLDAVPGAREHAIPAKPIAGLIGAWDDLVADVNRSAAKLRVAVVGAGAGGVELCLAMEHRLRGRATFSLISRTPSVLPASNRRAQRLVTRMLEQRGIALHVSAEVTRLDDQTVWCGDRAIAADRVFWVTEASAQSWLAESGLELTDHGFVATDRFLRSVSHPHVFAVGDVATMVAAPRPKAGVFAVRQGRPLDDNLRATVEGRGLRPVQLQREFLTILGTGEKTGVSSRGHWTWSGRSQWQLKEYIDRKFMRQFADLPPMPMASSAPDHAASGASGESPAIRCQGCGAKVGPSILSETLQRLRQEGYQTRPPVGVSMSSFDAPDDAVALDFAAPTKLLQTIDYLPALLSDPLLFARIATLHCLSDLYAMGATPHSALASVVVPFAADALMKSDLHQMLAGIMRELDAAGAALIGGHTAEGPVEAIGLTANGIAGQKLLTKGGLRPGDKLILTKPLGVGCLFAGAMQGRAKGYWIDRAIDGMLQSNGPAAAALEAAGSTGATDVTGFGLFGHLAEMLVASGVQASVELSRIPFYEGALELARRGVRSSLHRQNQGHVATWLSAVQNWDDPRVILAMDPQTSGGLVAGLRPELVSKCLKDLHQRGFAKACVIGEVTGHAAPGMAPLLLDEA